MQDALIPLEQTAALRILVTLFKNKQLTLTALSSKVNCSHSALYTALKKLYQAKLITETREEDFPRRRLISLTDRGRKVAELLVEIEKILGA
ncbi:MAG: helix-turn-helix transcriptional regulator [Candidatus Njordarchaeales archaeon]